MHIDTSILLSIQKHPIIHSRILQKHLLYGYEFPKTKLVFALYGDSMHTITGTLKTISFVPNAGNWAEDERKWQEKAGKACENEKFVVILRSLLRCAVFLHYVWAIDITSFG